MRFFTSFWILILILFSTHVGWGQTVVTLLPFTSTSGSIDANISYTTEKNSSSTDPAINGVELRVYYHSGGNGGSITLNPANGATITDVEIYATSTSYTPTVKYNVDGGSDVTASLSGTTYTISSISASASLKIRNANTTNTQLRITGIKVTYILPSSNTPPDIISSLTASGSVGAAFTYSTTATNSPTSYSASGLPPGLTVNTTTGVISGTPISSGTYNVTLTATNAYGTDTETLVIVIEDAPCYTGHAPNFINSGSISNGDTDTGGSPTTTIRLASSSSGGSISTTATGVTAGDVTVRFRAKGWSSLETNVTVTIGGQSTLITNLPTTFGWVTVNFSGVAANPTLTFSTVTKKRFHIGNVEIICTPANGPEIAIEGNSVEIVSGDTSPSTTDHTSFGNVCASSGSITRTFTIRNTGNQPLGVSNITTSNTTDFTIGGITLPTTIAASASTTFTVDFDPVTNGTKTSTITVSNNDSNEGTYTFAINGVGDNAGTPNVNIAPNNNPACVGSTVTFTATPSNLGGGTASYQWKVNGTNVGSNSTTFTSSSLTSGDVITCEMTVAGGCVSSATANSNSITITIYPEATVTFNKNAASATGTMANQTACQATNLTSNAYTNSGFTFSGWNTQPDGTGTSYADGQSYAFTTSITLYAIWDVYLGPCLQQLSFSGLPTSWIQTDVIFTSGEAEFDKTSGELTTISVAYPTSLSFSLRRTSNATNKMMYVEVATSLAGPYTQVGLTYDHSNTTSNGTTNITVDLMAYNIYPEVYVRFKKVSSTTSPWYLRNIEIYCQASCAHTITGFNPENGPVGTEITITGTGFTPSTIVKIGGQLTSVTYVNSTTLIAEILPGTTTGEIIIVEDFCYVDGNTFTVTSNSGSCPSDLGGLSDVFISEVFDSNVNNNWYMELFNPTNSTIDLAAGNYQIIRYASIGGGGVATTINLTGVIPPMSVFKMRLGSSSGGCSGLTFDLDVNGGGINENNEIGLYRNGVLIDIVHTPNETGYSLLRDNQAIAPSSTFSSSDWTTLSDESCNDFGVFSLPDLVPEISIITSNGCANLDFSVTATPGSGGTLTYKWYFNENNGIAGDWIVVSSANLAGLVVSGETTNNLIINAGTSPISSIENYQFYCEVTESGSCSNVSNAERFNPEGERYYKSTQSGNWTTVSTWLMAPAVSGPWSAACTYPTATNSDYISIENGHTVTLDIDLDADQIIVQSTGTLVLNEKLTVPNGNASTEDLLVEGTLIDNGNTTNGIAFVNGGTWLLGTQGTIIKTWSSDVLPFKNNYQGGISTIPATAHWYYRYVGNDLVVTTTVGMYYPNLYFESSAGFHAWDAATEVLSGSTATAVVKGNLSIGATNTGTVEVFNNNTFASPILVHGNVYVGAGSALRNTSQGGGIGTGFEIKGETIEIEGNYVMESGTTGKTVLSGAVLQTIVSLTGNGQFLNAHVELNNTNDARLNGIDMDISSTLTFTDGVIHTILAQADKVNITNSSNTAIINGQAESAQNRYINGKLQWNLANGNVYTFPVGYTKGTVGAQGFNFTVDNGAGAVLAYLEPNSSAPLVDYAYCDFEQVVGATSGTVGSGSPGYDGILDQIEYNIHSPLQWNITNPTGGSITQYDIRVLATGLQDITPVVSANNVPVRYLMRNGQPGNPTVPTLTAPGFTELGFEMCPNQYTLLNMTGFSFFTLDGATQNGTVLPIEVVSFTGEAVDNNAAILNWITATELNNDFFTLFYSNDGFQFEELVRIAGAGTSTQTNHYIYRHTPLSKGVHYYKLFSTDYDGTTYYRGIVAVQIEGVQAYFNTITSTIELAEKDDVKLYTTDGKLIAEGTNVNSIPVNHKGVFLLHYVRSGKTERLVIY